MAGWLIVVAGGAFTTIYSLSYGVGGGRLEGSGQAGLPRRSQPPPSHDVIRKYFVIENISSLVSALLVCPRLAIISHNYFPQPATALCCYINNVIKIKHNNINDVILSSAAFRQKK